MQAACPQHRASSHRASPSLQRQASSDPPSNQGKHEQVAPLARSAVAGYAPIAASASSSTPLPFTPQRVTRTQRAGPVALSTRDSGGGISWLYPLIDGAPPVGWETAAAYCVLPVLLVVAQIASSLIISPVDPNQENATTQKVLIYVLPFMLGYFSLTVPSGLSLYYFSNSVFTSAQQIYFRKLGGATVDTPDLGPVTKLGMGRRTGTIVEAEPVHASTTLPRDSQVPDVVSSSLAAEFGDAAPVAATAGEAPAAAAPADGVAAFGEAGQALTSAEWMLENTQRCKRKKSTATA